MLAYSKRNHGFFVFNQAYIYLKLLFEKNSLVMPLQVVKILC